MLAERKASRTKSLKGYVDGNASFYFVVNLGSKTTRWCLVSISSVWYFCNGLPTDTTWTYRYLFSEHMWISFSDKWKKGHISKISNLPCPALFCSRIWLMGEVKRPEILFLKYVRSFFMVMWVSKYLKVAFTNLIHHFRGRKAWINYTRKQDIHI